MNWNRNINGSRTLLAVMCLAMAVFFSALLQPGMWTFVLVFTSLAAILAGAGGFVRGKQLGATGLVDAFVFLAAIVMFGLAVWEGPR